VVEASELLVVYNVIQGHPQGSIHSAQHLIPASQCTTGFQARHICQISRRRGVKANHARLEITTATRDFPPPISGLPGYPFTCLSLCLYIRICHLITIGTSRDYALDYALDDTKVGCILLNGQLSTLYLCTRACALL
jgi:hypothetical protein